MPFFNTSSFHGLLQQTWPMLIGLFAIMGSQLVDSAFIGQLGTDPLAVLGFTIPIYQLIIGIQVGLGITTTALISSALGANDKKYAKDLATLILMVGVITMTLLCVLLWYYQEKIALYLGADITLLSILRDYWFPWLLSSWLGAMLYFGYSILRSQGQTVIPGKIMVMTSVLNVILDPILMFSFDMGLAGAAWATCLSFLVGCLIIFRAIIRNHLMSLPCDLSKIKAGFIAIFSNTIPAILSQFIPPISAILVTIIIATYGDFAIGAWGLANRIEYISIILILALTMALPPMIGNLKGRNEFSDIFQLVKTALSIVIIFQLTVTLLILLTVNSVTNLLTSQSEIASILQRYLWIVPVSYGALGVCMICVCACNAMGLPKSALIISILRLFACYLPLIWLGSQLYGLLGIFIGATMGNFLSGSMGWFMFLKQYNKTQQNINVRLTQTVANH